VADLIWAYGFCGVAALAEVTAFSQYQTSTTK
jgi:hypothetical protein